MAKIIVIESDSSMNSFLQTALCSAGHTLRMATDGKDALAKHKADPALLIVLDLCSPRMDGLNTLRAVRDQDDLVKILAITQTTVLGDPTAVALAAGATRTVEQPCSTPEIAGVVRSMLKE